MTIKKILTSLFAPVVAAGSLAACSGQPDGPPPTVCVETGDGIEVIDRVSKEKIFTMGEVHEQRDDYIWANSEKMIDGVKSVNDDFNVYLNPKTGEIKSCMVGDITYPAAPKGPTGP